MGICETGPAGLVERKANFKKIVNRMGRWPGYGGSAVAMGEWPAYGDLPRCMGRCVRRVIVWGNRENVWGNGLCGRPQNRMGSRENVWEMPRDMGNGASIWGGRQAVWGAKNHIKTGTIGTVGGLRTLQILMNFWWEAAARHSLPSRLRAGFAANVAAPKIPRLRHLALASS